MICFTAVPEIVRLTMASNHITSELIEASYVFYVSNIL